MRAWVCVSFFLFLFFFCGCLRSSKKRQKYFNRSSSSGDSRRKTTNNANEATHSKIYTDDWRWRNGWAPEILVGWSVWQPSVTHIQKRKVNGWCYFVVVVAVAVLVVVFFFTLIDSLGFVSLYRINRDAEDWTLPRVTIRAFERRMFTHSMSQLVHKRYVIRARWARNVENCEESAESERKIREFFLLLVSFVCFLFKIFYYAKQTPSAPNRSQTNTKLAKCSWYCINAVCNIVVVIIVVVVAVVVVVVVVMHAHTTNSSAKQHWRQQQLQQQQQKQ